MLPRSFVARRARGDLSALAQDPGPGPGSYAGPSALGDQALSTKANAETAKFKTGNRWSEYKSDIRKDLYCASHAIGDQRLPGTEVGGAPGVTISSKCARYDPMKQGTPGNIPSYLKNPGPGQYQQESSFGRQLMSKKSSAPTGKIGSDTRQQRAKLYLTRDHEKEHRGTHSPGPNYDLGSSLGPQKLSKMKNSAGFKFGSGSRFSELKPVEKVSEGTGKIGKGSSSQSAPGPGQYTV